MKVVVAVVFSKLWVKVAFSGICRFVYVFFILDWKVIFIAIGNVVDHHIHLNVGSTELFELISFFTCQNWQFEFLQLLLKVIALLEVLVDHKDASVFAMPSKRCFHAYDSSILPSGEEGRVQTGIQHVY